MSRADPAAAVALSARLSRATRGIRWYVRGVLGEDAYERYLAHHARTRCDHRPMTEREFWRDRTDAMEKDPKSRCC
jgi:uncharacterized short protein YbdD (DUF466 family)